MNNKTSKSVFVTVAILTCFCIASLTSCGNDPPHPTYINAVDTYLITFSGDRDVFRGELSISTISQDCILKSDFFDEESKNLFSDRNFKESYEFELHSKDWGQPRTVSIHCCALWFSDKEYSMKCCIYKLPYIGEAEMIEDIEFHSFPIGSHPTSEQYSFTIKL